MHFGILRRRQRLRCSTSNIDLTNVTKSPLRRDLSEGGFLFASSHLFARAGMPMSNPASEEGINSTQWTASTLGSRTSR
jgi:hypothetical protein